jgi:hypothetical protein
MYFSHLHRRGACSGALENTDVPGKKSPVGLDALGLGESFREEIRA